MQFFPAFNFDAPQAMPEAKAALGKAGGLLTSGRTALDKAGNGLNFAALLSETGNLADARLAPFNDALTPGIPKGFASTRDDTGKIKTRDLNFLESKLRGGGVDEDVLQNFMTGLFSGPELPTVGQILGAVRNQGRAGEALNDQEKIAFSSLMQRIGYNTEEIAQMEELSYQGKGLSVLKDVEARLAKAAGQNAGQNAAQANGQTAAQNGKQAVIATETLHLTKEELGALAKLFNLSEKSSQAIMERFGDNAEQTVSARDFSKLFASAKAELSREEGQMNRIRALAPEAVKDMLDNAKLAASKEVNASNRGSRKLERSEIVMRDGATLIDEDEDEDEKNGTSTSKMRRKSILSELGAKADKSETERTVADALREAQNKDGGQNERGERLSDRAARARAEARGEDSGGQASSGNGKFDKNGDSREFGDILKQDADRAFQKAEAGGASGREILSSKLENLTGANFAQAQQSQPNGAANLADTRAALHQDRIFEQVEQGIIRNAANGSKQITMRLDPPDLGRLTLQLTVNNGEVKALIRTEQTDVTRVVSEQLAALKASLEEQGFKVASLDVETRPENQPDMQNWNSAEQHNKEQELEARANFLRLAKSRAQEGEALARNMQNIPQQAQIAESGLHIVA